MTENILFIDDSTLEYELFTKAAEGVGFEGKTFCLTDPRQLFNHLQKEEALPDLIMIDVRMPHLNGHQLTRKLKMHPLYNHIYRVMFSSSDLLIEREKAVRSGANYYFCKPDEFMDYPMLVMHMLTMARENRQVA